MSSNRRRKQRQNPLIIGDTTIPQTGKKNDQKCGPEFGGLRHLTFGAQNLLHSDPFLDYLYEFWHLLSALGSDVRKKLYTCTSTFSALNCCSGIFFKSLSYLYEVVRKTFPPIFELFETFDRNFANLVAPPSDKNENYVVRLNEQSLPKNSWKSRRNRLININALLVRTMHPSNEQRAGLVAWQKTNKQTLYFRTYSRGAYHDLPQTLRGDGAHRAYQKGNIHFSIQRIVFPTGCTEKFGAVFQQ